MTRTSRFGFSSGLDPDPARHWDTKRKQLRLVEVGAQPGAVLVCEFLFLFLFLCASYNNLLVAYKEASGLEYLITLKSCSQRLYSEVEGIRAGLDHTRESCTEVLARSPTVPSQPNLRSELSVVLQKAEDIYSLSSVYLEKYVNLT